MWLGCIGLAAAQTPPTVVATTTIIADMARQLAGDDFIVHSLLPLGADPHVYEAVPGDAQLLAEADLILQNGLHLEGWLQKLIDQRGPKGRIAVVTEGIQPISSSEYANSYDPHAWMDPQLGLIYVQNIYRALLELRPDLAESLETRFFNYTEKLKQLDLQIEQQLSAIPASRRYIATSHDAFRYFAKRYGFEVISILGTTTDAEVRTEDLQALIRIIEEQDLPAIFIESTINPKLMNQVAADAGIRIGGKLYADSMGPKGSGADSYTGMLSHAAQTLHAGLLATGPAASMRRELGLLGLVAVFFVLAFVYVARQIQQKKHEKLNKKYTLEVENLTVAYENRIILNNFRLKLEAGKLYGLLGPNGSGKSTLFKSMLGLIETDDGQVSIGGHAVPAVRRQIAYVPQKEDIDWQFPATVIDVVLMGRYPHKQVFDPLKKADYDFARKQLRELDIEKLEDKQISALSGGQQQRVFLARALAQEAEIYLLDEPFVGVDITTEEKIIGLLKKLVAQGKTVVMIHHDLSKATSYFDELILINRRLVAFGESKAVLTDENIRKTFSGTQALYDKAAAFNA